MEEFERQNPNKRKTQVFIKTMRRGNVVSKEKRTMGGRQPQDENRFEENFYNYLQHSFPEENYLDDFSLHHYRYPANGEPTGIVFLFHDQGGHCGRYAHVAEFLASKDLEVVCFDLPGHGKNQGGTRGYFGSFADVNAKAKEFILATVDKFNYSDKPKFTLGMSTAALTAISLALENDRFFNGVSVVNPCLKNDGYHPRFYKYVDFLGKAFPKLGMIKYDPNDFQPFSDPLQFKGKLTAGFFKELDDMSYHIRNNAHKLTVPLFLAHGGIDDVTLPETVRKYFENVETSDKDIVLYDD